MKLGTKVNSVTLLSAITLESTEATTQATSARVVLDTADCEVLNLACTYTTGAAETSNTASITIWGYAGTFVEDAAINADTAGWYQLGEHSITTGTATFVATTFNITGASAATAYQAHFTVDIAWKKIRIGALESGVATNKGTLTVVANAL